jgi:antitoxin HicB
MTKTKTARAGLGSRFEDFLRETGDYEVVTEAALKQVLAWQLEQAREEQGVTKADLAARMNTSRSQLNRLLDPSNADVTLAALQRAAAALGRTIRLELSDERTGAVAKAKAKKAVVKSKVAVKAARRTGKAHARVTTRASKYG